MDRLEAMTVLVAVVEAGSLSAASRRLGMPLATVSRKLLEMEQHLKTRLINRSSRRMTVTDSGRPYVEACKRILDQLADAEREARGESRSATGHLTLTAPLVFGRRHALPVVIDFLRAYPAIDLRLNLSDHLLNLLEDRVDVALRIGVLPASSLVAKCIGATRHVVCASPEYLAARARPQRPEDLAEHDCITFENLASPRGWTFRKGRSERLVPIHSRLSVTTAEAAIDAAVAGVGFTRVLSYMIEDLRRAGRLVLVLETFEPAAWPIHLVHAGQKPLPVKLRAFLDYAVPRLTARLKQ
ncbi:MAG: LysR family transcriptional regulator [Deltaproteobacteria bacterium]|nr:LysR family transcriptional regulator [Deltaproteobacteria bacterium]